MPICYRLWKMKGRDPWPLVLWVRFGSLRRVTPISRNYGVDRGLPIDRYYIENFLARYGNDIRGHVLEIKDDSYTSRFGGNRVTRSDVLHTTGGHPKATLVGDLTCADHIPSDTFDCLVITQTLQFIYDVRAAINTLHRILKPGGVLLATLPGVSQIARHDWGDGCPEADCWCWSFTTVSARRMFEEAFPVGEVVVEAYGNVLAAVSFLHRLAVEELRREELDYRDPDYPFLITVRATKAGPA